MSKLNLYLAGPIAGLSKREANGWREQANAVLNVYYHVVNPLRNYIPDNEDEPITLTDGNPRNFIARDLFDVNSADLLLVNFNGARQPSSGTTYELGYARARNIPYALVVDDEHRKYTPPFIYENAAWVFESVDEALVYLAHLASPYVDD